MISHSSYRYALIAAVTTLLNGCATFFPESCEQFEERRKKTNYATEYHRDSKKEIADLKPLGKGEMAVVLNYQMRLDTERARPCSHVSIQKELTLVRRSNSGIIIEETREFFAEDGTRIAVKNEVLTTQLNQTGRYTASVPLPIPKSAPAGKYRLTSTLTLKTKGATKATTLAKTAVNFEVASQNPPQKKK